MPWKLCLRAWKMWRSGWDTTGFSSIQVKLNGSDILDLLVGSPSIFGSVPKGGGFSWTHSSCLRRSQPWLTGPLHSLKVVISCTHPCTRDVAAHGHSCSFYLQIGLLQCV
uniref:Uncharacterized protein n=1 Tax=Micrurus spixii TaxID=129469 RepID=A0A2D4N151_9SAUR